jgi:hypothetical protein
MAANEDFVARNVFWTRMAIVSITQDCDNRASIQNRLMRNYQDMETTLGPYLGNKTAIRYGDLIERILSSQSILPQPLGIKTKLLSRVQTKAYLRMQTALPLSRTQLLPNWQSITDWSCGTST